MWGDKPLPSDSRCRTWCGGWSCGMGWRCCGAGSAGAREGARAGRVRALVAGGGTVAAAAAAVGVNPTSAYRYLQVGGRQD